MSASFDRLRRNVLGLVLFAAVGGLVAGAGWAASASMRSTTVPVAAPAVPRHHGTPRRAVPRPAPGRSRRVEQQPVPSNGSPS